MAVSLIKASIFVRRKGDSLICTAVDGMNREESPSNTIQQKMLPMCKLISRIGTVTIEL